MNDEELKKQARQFAKGYVRNENDKSHSDMYRSFLAGAKYAQPKSDRILVLAQQLAEIHLQDNDILGQWARELYSLIPEPPKDE